jgi:hypothetical protein
MAMVVETYGLERHERVESVHPILRETRLTRLPQGCFRMKEPALFLLCVGRRGLRVPASYGGQYKVQVVYSLCGRYLRKAWTRCGVALDQDWVDRRYRRPCSILRWSSELPVKQGQFRGNGTSQEGFPRVLGTLVWTALFFAR